MQKLNKPTPLQIIKVIVYIGFIFTLLTGALQMYMTIVEIKNKTVNAYNEYMSPLYWQPVHINVPRAKAEEELPMKEWVLKQFADNGINTEVADCVITRESQWNDQHKPSATNDYGLMQWNVQHIDSGLITMSCVYDYKCAVSKAIEKIKKDKGFSAWFGYRDANCGRFGKTFIN